MKNKYLSYDEKRASRVREMFSRLAWRYDLVNDVMSAGLHRRWKRETVRLAVPATTGTARVLDLCCGSGDLCFLAEGLGAGSVLGADFTLPMLAVARRRGGSCGATGSTAAPARQEIQPLRWCRGIL